MLALLAIIVVGSTVWVGLDARKRDFSDVRFADNSAEWIVGCILLWIVVFPIYLVQRSRAPLIERQPSGGRNLGLVALVVLALVVLGALYARGTFDRVLVNVGLNAKECGRNGFGATFCGQELVEYRERIAKGEREGKETGEKIERESREAEAKIQRELKADEENPQQAEEEAEGSG
jgi:hypothetical protein